MNIKHAFFVLILTGLTSGCTTTDTRLEKKVEDLALKVSALEQIHAEDNQHHAVNEQAAGWMALDSWQKLETGMSYEAVEAILGPAHKIYGGAYPSWHYSNGGAVKFVNGALISWKKPKKTP